MQNLLVREPDSRFDLESLLREELRLSGPEPAEIVIGGPNLALRSQAAATFGLAMHELASNALKFGPLARAGGHLSVPWNIGEPTSGSRLRLDWIESCGEDLPQPGRHGFGMELLTEILPYELGATGSRSVVDRICVLCEIPLTAQVLR